MLVQIRTAGYAAFVFFFALMTHCINAFYVLLLQSVSAAITRRFPISISA